MGALELSSVRRNKRRAAQDVAAAAKATAAAEAAAAAAADEKLCRYCGEKIKLTATYCKICSKYQNWSDAFINGITITTVIAILPVIALIYAYIHDKVIFNYSKVSAAIVECRPANVLIGFSNSGTRSAIVAKGHLDVDVDGNFKYSRDLVRIGEKEKDTGGANTASVILPGTTLLNDYDITKLGDDSPGPIQPSLGAKSCLYKIHLSVTEFAKALQRDEAVSCACPV